MTFALRQPQGKCCEQKRSLFITLVDLTEAFHTVGRKGLWMILQRLGCFPKSPCTIVQLHDNKQALDNELDLPRFHYPGISCLDIKNGLNPTSTKMLFDVAKHCSDQLSVGDFKAKCASIIGACNVSCVRKSPNEEEIAASIQTDAETVTELMDICSPDNLKCPLENQHRINMYNIATLPDTIPLKTISLLKKGKSRTEDINYINLLGDPKESLQEEGEGDLDGGTVLLSAIVYHPTRQRKEQGYLVLAGQYLTELRDKIECVADKVLLGERSLNPNISDAKIQKENCNSGFFFIEGVFYNDMRDPYNRDYSKAIVEWAKENSKWKLPGLGSFKSKRMEDTKFEELKIRLGYPYYYCHQGNCEHLIIFNDMRLLHADDPQHLSHYPYRIFKDRPKRTKCSVCDLYTARWVTFDDIFAFEDPSFFCTQCFDLLHYNERKEKIHDFKAYYFNGSYICQDKDKANE